MNQQDEGRRTGPTETGTGGSRGTPGRAGRDQDENARVANASPGDVRSGAQATEDRLGGTGSQRTAADRGSEFLDEVPGMQAQVERWGAGTRGGEADLRRREEELGARGRQLDERERQLREREQRLQERERGMGGGGAVGER